MKTSNNHIGKRSASTNCATAYPTRLCRSTVLTEQYSITTEFHAQKKRIQIDKEYLTCVESHTIVEQCAEPCSSLGCTLSIIQG